MEEKRKSVRMEIDVMIKLSAVEQSKKDVSKLDKGEFEVELVNVSRDGIAFYSTKDLLLNTFYDTKMILWTKETFNAIVEIVRMENMGTEKTLYGCRFIGISAAEQFKIQIYELVNQFADK